MLKDTFTFDELPGAVSSLANLIRELANEVRELRAQLASERSNNNSTSGFIGLDEACKILGKARSTVYNLARDRKIPAYKVPGEKAWRFIKEELISHVKSFKTDSTVLTFDEMATEISRGTRVKSLNRR